MDRAPNSLAVASRAPGNSRRLRRNKRNPLVKMSDTARSYPSLPVSASNAVVKVGCLALARVAAAREEMLCLNVEVKRQLSHSRPMEWPQCTAAEKLRCQSSNAFSACDSGIINVPSFVRDLLDILGVSSSALAIDNGSQVPIFERNVSRTVSSEYRIRCRLPEICL
jgi:hypothetical protein